MAGHRQRSDGPGTVGRRYEGGAESPGGEDPCLPPSPTLVTSPARSSSRRASSATESAAGIAARTNLGTERESTERRARGKPRGEGEESRETPGADEFSRNYPASSFIARKPDYRCDLVASGGAQGRREENASAIELSGSSLECRDITILRRDPCRRRSHVRKGTIVSDSDGRIEAEDRARTLRERIVEKRRAREHTERSLKRKQDGGRRVGWAGGREGGRVRRRRHAERRRVNAPGSNASGQPSTFPSSPYSPSSPSGEVVL